MSVTSAVNKILEGRDITSSLMNESQEEYFYEVVYNYHKPVIVKLDRKTTDYGAIIDLVIDHLEDSGVKEPYLIDVDQAEREYSEDEYIIGGNHGLALVHNGLLNIVELPAEKALQYAKEDKVEIIEEALSAERTPLKFDGSKLEKFISKLNNNDTNKNVVAYSSAVFSGNENIKLVFYRNDKALYKKLLEFCAENDYIILSTHPATYTTVIRFDH